MSNGPETTVTIPTLRSGERIEIATFGKKFTWAIGVAPKGLRCGFAKTAQAAAEAATLAILELRANGK